MIVRVAMGRSYETKLTNVVESTIHFKVRGEYNTSTTTPTMAETIQKSASATRVGQSVEALEKPLI